MNSWLTYAGFVKVQDISHLSGLKMVDEDERNRHCQACLCCSYLSYYVRLKHSVRGCVFSPAIIHLICEFIYL